MLTLESNHWYAMEVWAADWPECPHASPVRVLRVLPLKQGDGLLRLELFHAAYPEGVQRKEYTLRVLHRSAQVLIAVSAEPSQDRTFAFFPLTADWFRAWWPELVRDPGVPLTDFLDRHFQFAGS